MYKFLCEKPKDVEKLWKEAAKGAHNYIHEEIKDLEIREEELNKNSKEKTLAIAETAGEVNKGELIVVILVDPIFYGLDEENQAAVVCHEMGHAEKIFQIYDKLLSGELKINTWNEEAKNESKAHDNVWKQITTKIASANMVNVSKATVPVMEGI